MKKEKELDSAGAKVDGKKRREGERVFSQRRKISKIDISMTKN